MVRTWGVHPARRKKLKERLDTLVATQDRAARRADDPVEFVHRYTSADDQEVVGLVAALLAFGNVVVVRRSVAYVLERLGASPADAVERLSAATISRRLGSFRHRVYGAEDVAVMLANAGVLRRAHGTLGQAFARSLEEQGDIGAALAVFADALRGSSPSRGLAHLVPDPRKGSASKRLWLYLRWMIRPADGVDLGLWPVDPSALFIPVDTHVLRIGRNLGLTARTDASLRTSEEITRALRELDAADPVRYDFAICHLGVSRACPSRRVDATCRECALRTVCLAFAGKLEAEAPVPASALRAGGKAGASAPRDAASRGSRAGARDRAGRSSRS